MSDIFISYAREDLTPARRLAGTLESQGWSVFWDRTIPAGKSWREVIGAALDDARCVVVLWSKQSVGSSYVLEEAERGLERCVLIPAFLEAVRPPLGFRGIHAADLSDWAGELEDTAIKQFLGDIAGVLNAAPVAITEDRPAAKGKPARKTEEEQRQQAEVDAQRKITDERGWAKAHPKYGTGAERAQVAADSQEIAAEGVRTYTEIRPPPRRPWPVLVLLLVIAIVSPLLLLPVPTTEVTLALDLSSLTFRIGSDIGPGGPEQVELLGRIHTDQVTIDDVDGVELDDIPLEQSSAANFRLSAGGDGEFSIRPLEVPVGTWVRVKPPDQAGGMTVELAHPTEELALALSFPPEVEVLSSDPELTERFGSMREVERVVFRAEPPAEADDCARLRFRWLVPGTSSGAASPEDGSNASPFQSTIPVDALLFIDLTGGSRHLSTRFSSVLGGSVYLEAVDGRQVPIRRDQLLDLGLGALPGYDPVQASGGPGFCAEDAASAPRPARARILRLAVGDDAIALQATATVDRLSTGTATHRQDLMPRWLEWLQTRQELLLFWGAIGSLFGLAYAVLLWWRGTR